MTPDVKELAEPDLHRSTVAGIHFPIGAMYPAPKRLQHSAHWRMGAFGGWWHASLVLRANERHTIDYTSQDLFELMPLQMHRDHLAVTAYCPARMTLREVVNETPLHAEDVASEVVFVINGILAPTSFLGLLIDFDSAVSGPWQWSAGLLNHNLNSLPSRRWCCRK